MILNYTITKNDITKYSSINEHLTDRLKFSSNLLSKLIRLQNIKCNNIICDTRNKPIYDSILSIDFGYEEDNSNIVPNNIKLDIVYEDDWLIVLNKPAGIAIHPSLLHYDNSLSNGVRFYFDSINLKKKIRPVNRLDFNTSGLVVFAKCEYIQECLIKQMESHIFKKEYLCIVEGKLSHLSGSINLPIARKDNSIIERVISPNGKNAITHYEVLKEFNNFSLVKCSLETGRTHQIRVHFSSIGHPLVGDTLYGHASNILDRQALHSYKLEFVHPITNKKRVFVCDLPNALKKIIV